MGRLPVVSGREVLRALLRAGFEEKGWRGGHAVLRHPETRRSVPVPLHGGRDLPPCTVRTIIRQAGLTVDEFVELLK